ncbi:ABC transporter permease [Cellulomonas sp. PhB150]|uniref:ABC transporter permease n=1 Tax=Cellulomonas sp. PhB150 TaxID=2485188 RepID=UPI000F48CCD3|nr:ABC transporter permease [Cellulomonas sp. PhB150]ROS23633.1 ABC-type nitrate/sulfonate/bicarbonate transport system permease component [Cellulomonas sp. PhB150]
MTRRRVVAPLVAAAVLVGAWEIGVRASGLPPFVLPAPSEVAATGVRVAPLLVGHVVTTLQEAALGLVLGAVVGMLLAVVIAAFPVVADTVYPLVTVTQTVPTVVLAPLLILWAGFGLLPKVLLVALTVFFPVLVSAVTAMSDVDGAHVDMVAGLGGRRWHQFALVRLPAAVPGVFGGLRVATTYVVGAAVVAEYLAGTSGLGVFIQRSRKSYDVDQILVAVVVIAVLTGVLFLIVDALGRLATPWRRSTT